MTLGQAIRAELDDARRTGSKPRILARDNEYHPGRTLFVVNGQRFTVDTVAVR